MTDSFTLGILETGRPPETLAKDWPSYAAMFADMVGATAPDHWQFEYYAVMDGEFPPSANACQAWLITGSKFGAYEDYPWIQDLKAFIRQAYDAGVPMVGICFGHQILAQSLGGEVIKSEKGWGVGRHSYHWTDETPSWLAGTGLEGKEDFSILAFHQDQIVKIPPDAKLLASSDFCEAAALVYGDQVLSFQGHPEFEEGYVARLLDDKRADALGDEIADRAMTSLELPIDRLAIGGGIVAFLTASERAWRAAQEKKAAQGLT